MWGGHSTAWRGGFSVYTSMKERIFCTLAEINSSLQLNAWGSFYAELELCEFEFSGIFTKDSVDGGKLGHKIEELFQITRS